MHTKVDALSLVGRARELAILEACSREAAISGEALLLVGEPGVGKTVLLDAVAEMSRSRGTTVVRCSGAEFESNVSFAGLQQLVEPLTSDLQTLPAPLRTTLDVALGVGRGPAPQRLAVMTATLELFRLAASRSPLVIVVDDMQWLDSATGAVIGFLGRRLAGSRICLLGATRSGAGGFVERVGLPRMRVEPLAEHDALAMLTHQFTHLPTRLLREVAHEAQGNPLALLEFAASAGSRQSGGPHSAVASTGIGRNIRSLYEERAASLPAATRRLLLLAALEGSGHLSVLAAASDTDNLEDLGPAERDHLVVINDQLGHISFRHPMIKSVLVEQSTHEERRRAHEKLAEQFVDQPERRGFHVAEATDAPDEQAARIVEVGAQATLARGDVLGAVSRLLRAADLSPNLVDRSRRLADAAFVGADSGGQLEGASHLLRSARLDDLGLGETLHAAAASAYLLLNSEGDVRTAHKLLTVAIESATADDDLDQDGLSDAMYTLVLVCHFSAKQDHWHVFHRAMEQLGEAAPTEARLLSEAFADPSSATPRTLSELDQAVDRLPETQDVATIVRTSIAARFTGRFPGCRDSLDRVVRDGSEGGAVSAGILALLMIAMDDLDAGKWEEAASAADRATALCEEHGYRLHEWTGRYTMALIAANRGERRTCDELCTAIEEWGRPRELGRLSEWAHHARARAALGVGDFEGAYAHASNISPPGKLSGHSPHALLSALDLVDAALHTGRIKEAREHAATMREARLGRLSPRFDLVVAAAAAMAAHDGEALELFDRALALPSISRSPFELAWVQLAHGERLRRLRRVREARAQLAHARDGFARLGAQSWAERASLELRATGSVRQTAANGVEDSLTPQELEVAELAASGLTNREIATRLFVSPRTVSGHLYRVFPKLGVSSRAALRDALLFGRAGRARMRGSPPGRLGIESYD